MTNDSEVDMDFRTITVSLTMEIRLDTSEDDIVSRMVEAAEDVNGVLAAWETY